MEGFQKLLFRALITTTTSLELSIDRPLFGIETAGGVDGNTKTKA